MEAEKSSGRPMVWRVAGWVLFCCMGFAGGIPVHAEAVPEPVRETVQAGSVAETQGMTRYADVPVRLVREKAQAGDEVAQLELGLRYLHGIEGVRDVPAGVRWIEKAASSGMPQAEHELGALYQMGIGVPRDAQRAVEWFRKAAIQGYAPSQTALGFAYENGTGVKQNGEKAAYWFEKAAASGDGIARESVEAGM